MRFSPPAAALVFALAFASSPAGAGAEDSLARAADAALEKFLIPAHERFAESASAHAAAVSALCASPGADNLRTARRAFARAVRGFSAVEMLRFGPARTDNRLEKIFFWPDRRGRGAQQARKLIQEKNPDAAIPEKLRVKSAAVQGLPALDELLHGAGAEKLAEGDSHRCAYAESAAALVRGAALSLRAGWRGAESAAFWNRDEAASELFRAMRDQIRAVRDFKILAALGDSPARARKSAFPFWRSDLAFAAMDENAAAVAELHGAMELEKALPDEWRGLARQLDFELSIFRSLLSDFRELEPGDVLSDANSRAKLRSAAVFLGGAHSLLAEDYPAALGIAPGFGSFDGD